MVTPRSTAARSNSKMPPSFDSHDGRCVSNALLFLSMKRTAATWPSPDASVYSSTGAFSSKLTCRGTAVVMLAIHHAMTSRRSLSNSQGGRPPFAYCLAEKGARWARPIRPNIRLWPYPSLPRILAASPGVSTPLDRTSFKSEMSCFCLLTGSIAATNPCPKLTDAPMMSILAAGVHSLPSSNGSPIRSHIRFAV